MTSRHWKHLGLALLLIAGTAAAGRHKATISEVLADLANRRPIDPTAPVIVGFSPGSAGYRAEDVVIQAVSEARHSVHVAAYSFTSKGIALALVQAKKRGVEVAVVVDRKENSKSYTAATFMANEGVPVRLDGNYAIMHNKFIVVDGRNLETGSFNFTEAAAKRNAENALLLRNTPDLAAIYDSEWRRLWAESATLAPRY